MEKKILSPKNIGKYSIVGVTTFGFDLLLLYFFVEFLKINYLIATIIAFIIAVSLNYYFNRKYTFSFTKSNYTKAYLVFMIIDGICLGIISLSMYTFVDILGYNYFISRIIIAGFIGLFNYALHWFITFRK